MSHLARISGFVLLFISCSSNSRMVRFHEYYQPKDKILSQCREILLSLDYEIDMFSTESYSLTTKSMRVRKTLRRYDYVLFVCPHLETPFSNFGPNLASSHPSSWVQKLTQSKSPPTAIPTPILSSIGFLKNWDDVLGDLETLIFEKSLAIILCFHLLCS